MTLHRPSNVDQIDKLKNILQHIDNVVGNHKVIFPVHHRTKNKLVNLGLKFIGKYKDDKAKVDAYLKKAKDEYKLPKTMMDDLKRAAGRGVE